ncbi:hypothetical protein Mgra_00002485, partial [Meloidogyne graminicola]
LKNIRYWLNQIFNCCDFGIINFYYFVFNPEIIKLLFNSEEINKIKFNCKKAIFSLYNPNIEYWEFTFNNLVINKRLIIHLNKINYTNNNILLNLILNKGNNIPSILISFTYNQIEFFKNFINVSKI